MISFGFSGFVGLGDRIKVRTIRGWKGNVIDSLSDGCALLFDRDNPYTRILTPDQSVDCSVTRVHPKYVIVNPIRELLPIKEGYQRIHPVDEYLIEDLENLASVEDRYFSTIVR